MITTAFRVRHRNSGGMVPRNCQTVPAGGGSGCRVYLKAPPADFFLPGGWGGAGGQGKRKLRPPTTRKTARRDKSKRVFR